MLWFRVPRWHVVLRGLEASVGPPRGAKHPARGCWRPWRKGVGVVLNDSLLPGTFAQQKCGACLRTCMR